MASKPLIKESLLFLNVCGLNPVNQSAWNIFRAAFSMILCVTLATEMVAEVVFNWNGLDSMDGVAILAGIYQIMLKLCMMVANSDKLQKLLHNINQLPEPSTHGEYLQHKLEDIYASAKKYLKIILATTLIALFAYFLIPYLLNSKRLPFATYHPIDRHQSPDYDIAYLLQTLCMVYEFAGLVGFDLLFLSSILHLIWESKVLKQKFSNIQVRTYIDGDAEDCLMEIYHLVDHHNIILRCIKSIEDIYSVLLLNQFLSSLICICAALLSIIADGFPPNGLTLFKEVAYLSIGLVQLFCYCLAGSYLMLETESIAIGVYESEWWIKTQPKLRRALVLVIQRANRTGKVTAGGMYILNLENFVSIVSSAYNLFTIVQAMYTR